MEPPALPPGLRALAIGNAPALPVGWLSDPWVERALQPPSPFRETPTTTLLLDASLDGFRQRTDALTDWARRIRNRYGVHGWRNEQMVVVAGDGEPLFGIERGMLRPLGLLLRTVQVNVHAQPADGLLLWVARRADSKPVDPGLLDTLVGGGIAGFDSADRTLLRECAEEAAIPAAIARGAVSAGHFETCRVALDDSLPVLHRERVALFDLRLPPDFRPRAADGEHQAILAMTPAQARATIGNGEWTVEGALATESLLRRRGWCS